VTGGVLRRAPRPAWTVTGRTLAGAAGVLGAGLAGGAGLAVGLDRLGPLIAVAVLAVAVFVAFVLLPKLTLVTLAAAHLVLEDDSQAFLSQSDLFYAGIRGGAIGVSDLLVLALLLGVMLRWVRGSRRPRWPAALGLPLAALAAAILLGAITGWFGDHEARAYFHGIRKLAYLVLLPILAVNVLETKRDLRIALGVFAVLVVYKCGEGMTSWLLGAGRSIEGTVLTFYSPAANFALLVFVTAVLGAALLRVRLPPLLWLVGPLAVAVLLLSFRRNFYLALVLCVVLVVLVVSGRQGRALLIPATAAVALALWLGFNALAATDSNSPVLERVQSLSPTSIELNAYDRYRLDEQRNVTAELMRHPLTGLGVGVPWTARHPVAVALPGGQQYVHASILWFWLKLGLLGAITYLWLMLAAARLGLRVWRNSATATVRVAGLALGVGLIGLMVAETTGAFVGVSERVTVLVGTALGWLVAADRLDRAAPKHRS
jgi:O-antigen ligase